MAAAAAPAVPPSIVSQDISINFTGSYTQIYGFLSDVEKNLRKVAVKGITLQKNQDNELTGQMNLSFISYWDTFAGQQPYSMEVQPITGKESLFMAYPGYSESSAKGPEAKVVTAQPDFSMLVNGYLDNAAKVILMQYPNTETEVAVDENEHANASLTINGNKVEFTYSYKVGSASKSGVTAIKARDGKIRMEVLVQARKSDKDKVSVTLDINNESDLPLEISVKGDNKQDPRFKLGKTTGNVVVK